VRILCLRPSLTHIKQNDLDVFYFQGTDRSNGTIRYLKTYLNSSWSLLKMDFLRFSLQDHFKIYWKNYKSNNLWILDFWKIIVSAGCIPIGAFLEFQICLSTKMHLYSTHVLYNNEVPDIIGTVLRIL